MYRYETYQKLDDILILNRNINFSYRTHMHGCLEFTFCTCGEVTVTVGDTAYPLRENEAVLIPQHVVHNYRTEQTSEFYTVLFGRNVMRDFANLFIKSAPEKYVFPMDSLLRALLLDYYGSERSLFGAKALLYRASEVFLRGNTFTEKTPMDALAVQIIEYIQQNFQEELTLEDFAKQTGYSYFYISKLIKKNFRMSFTELLAEYRVSYACSLLEQHSSNITEIALRAGFGSIRSFNRVFLQTTGMTPSQYLRGAEGQVNRA